MQHWCLISCHSALRWDFQNIVTISRWSSEWIKFCSMQNSHRGVLTSLPCALQSANASLHSSEGDTIWLFIWPWKFFFNRSTKSSQHSLNQLYHLWEQHPALSSREWDIKFLLVTTATSCLASEHNWSSLWPVQMTNVTLLHTRKLRRTDFHHRCRLAHANLQRCLSRSLSCHQVHHSEVPSYRS